MGKGKRKKGKSPGAGMIAGAGVKITPSAWSSGGTVVFTPLGGKSTGAVTGSLTPGWTTVPSTAAPPTPTRVAGWLREVACRWCGITCTPMYWTNLCKECSTVTTYARVWHGLDGLEQLLFEDVLRWALAFMDAPDQELAVQRKTAEQYLARLYDKVTAQPGTV